MDRTVLVVDVRVLCGQNWLLMSECCVDRGVLVVDVTVLCGQNRTGC